MVVVLSLFSELKTKFGESAVLSKQNTADGILTLWIGADKIKDILKYLKKEVAQPYAMLYDLTAIDERRKLRRQNHPESDFTLVYHLTSFERNQDIRLKVPLKGEYPASQSITDIWPCSDWYEREIFDMFGIRFDGHPNLRRILMPRSWKGHPLRKEHYARATEMGPYVLDEQLRENADNDLKFNPAEWGLKTQNQDTDFMFLNLGPQHPGTHGLLRLVLQLDGEDIVEVVPDIGFHHRGAEKMGERQSWHSFIPYTDRIDYLGGVMNNLAYLLSV
jgi:NADH-quinone oxidoreductase subunit C/D